MARADPRVMMADLAQYRAGYPGKKSDPSMRKNVQFYANEIRCQPDDMLIEDILTHWSGQYCLLESRHKYIQWLFPIRHQGRNEMAEELQPHEAERIGHDGVMRGRALRCLAMMLDFYGFELDTDTLQTRRLAHWQSRYNNLERNDHNYQRITRILKFLGEVGLERLKMPLLEHFAREVFVEGVLPGCEDTLCDCWVGTIRDDGTREAFAAKLAASRERAREEREAVAAAALLQRRAQRPAPGPAAAAPAPAAESKAEDAAEAVQADAPQAEEDASYVDIGFLC
eukprot:TRINITY_DN12351_c0_g4_i1.p1 TRINITY_DN12351_c0_g4~~TRINITY_DN12351_c0_g4_i1.p1  ORF type:complete len:284 (+),score=61.58 TRINITY_DN12351_c0_g4_i1:79-930(+)